MRTGNEDDCLLAWAALAEANYSSMIASVPGAEVIDTPHVLCVHTPIPTPLTNPVICRDLPTGAALDALITETRGSFAARGSPSGWYIAPRTAPPNLGQRLVAHGLVYKGGLPVMAMDLAQLSEEASLPDGCAIEEVEGREQWFDWGRTLAAGYGMPPAVADPLIAALTALPRGPGTPLRHYLAWLNGVPVATATLFRHAGAAGIYNVATLPAARGRGIGAAVTIAALRAGRACGDAVGTLQSSRMGDAVYRRIGFADCCTWEHYGEPTGAG